MTRKFDIMAAGHVCVDVIPRFPDTGTRDIAQIMRPGKLVQVAEAAISTGGPVSNTGMNVQTLGARVCFCARVGDDEFGRLAIRLLEARGNADGMHVVEGIGSSYTLVIAPPGIDRIFLHSPGSNDTFGPEDLEPALIAQCRHFHFGYPPLMRRMYTDGGEALARVFQIAKDAGATTSCDVALPDPASDAGKAPWCDILARVLPFVDLYLPSIEETLFMLHPDEFLALKQEHGGAELIDVIAPERYSQLADECIALGAKAVSLKSGHRGFYLKTAASLAGLGAAAPGEPENWTGRELWAPAWFVEHFGSATGSGDSAIAGLLAAFLNGCGIETALRYAVCCGWQNVQVLDAVSGIHPWEETSAMVARDMPVIDARVEGPGWRWNPATHLPHGPGDPA